jgi:hypothetical protein
MDKVILSAIRLSVHVGVSNEERRPKASPAHVANRAAIRIPGQTRRRPHTPSSPTQDANRAAIRIPGQTRRRPHPTTSPAHVANRVAIACEFTTFEAARNA